MIQATQQRYALKGLGTKGQRDKVLKGINLFFAVSFQLTHSASFSSTFLHLFVPASLIPTSLRRRRPLFIRSQFQISVLAELADNGKDDQQDMQDMKEYRKRNYQNKKQQAII